MPSSYAVLPQEEQRTISGGGELNDALNNFFENIHISDLFFGGGLISFSFTFVPMLFFNVVKTGVNVVFQVYSGLTKLFGFSSEEATMVQQYADRHRTL